MRSQVLGYGTTKQGCRMGHQTTNGPKSRPPAANGVCALNGVCAAAPGLPPGRGGWVEASAPACCCGASSAKHGQQQGSGKRCRTSCCCRTCDAVASVRPNDGGGHCRPIPPVWGAEVQRSVAGSVRKPVVAPAVTYACKWLRKRVALVYQWLRAPEGRHPSVTPAGKQLRSFPEARCKTWKVARWKLLRENKAHMRLRHRAAVRQGGPHQPTCWERSRRGRGAHDPREIKGEAGTRPVP